MSRKPLSSRNVEHPPRRGGGKKKGRGFTVNLALLVTDLNHILEEVTVHGPIVVTEDDLKSPTVSNLLNLFESDQTFPSDKQHLASIIYDHTHSRSEPSLFLYI